MHYELTIIDILLFSVFKTFLFQVNIDEVKLMQKSCTDITTTGGIVSFSYICHVCGLWRSGSHCARASSTIGRWPDAWGGQLWRRADILTCQADNLSWHEKRGDDDGTHFGGVCESFSELDVQICFERRFLDAKRFGRALCRQQAAHGPHSVLSIRTSVPYRARYSASLTSINFILQLLIVRHLWQEVYRTG